MPELASHESWLLVMAALDALAKQVLWEGACLGKQSSSCGSNLVPDDQTCHKFDKMGVHA